MLPQCIEYEGREGKMSWADIQRVCDLLGHVERKTHDVEVPGERPTRVYMSIS